MTTKNTIANTILALLNTANELQSQAGMDFCMVKISENTKHEWHRSGFGAVICLNDRSFILVDDRPEGRSFTTPQNEKEFADGVEGLLKGDDDATLSLMDHIKTEVLIDLLTQATMEKVAEEAEPPTGERISQIANELVDELLSAVSAKH